MEGAIRLNPPDEYDKARIVATLNRKYGTDLSVEVVEIAIGAGFSAGWEVLWLDSATFLASEEPTAADVQSIADLTNPKVV